MDEQSTAAESKPNFLKSATGLVAATTTLVGALAALLAAFDKLPFQKGSPAPVAAAAPAGAAAASASAAEAEEQTEPTLYTGKAADGTPITLTWDGDKWELRDQAGTYSYEELYSPDDTRKLAYDKANDLYLRWPVNGGLAEEGSEGEDGSRTWREYVTLDPVADAAAAE